MNAVVEWLADALNLQFSITTALAVRYFVFAGGASLIVFLYLKRRWLHRKIIQTLPTSAQVRREVLYSLSSVLIFGLVGTLTTLAARQGWTRFYMDPNAYGWIWFWASIPVLIVLHDTYFYWTHRMMHHRRLFRIFHRVHHRSHNPSPWATYSFAPPEAVVQAGIFPLAAFTLPLHPGAFGIFMLWQISFNVGGHVGYEFYPRRLMDTPLRYVLNTATNHVMHHEKVRCNYGIYFNVWDRLMGTNHGTYEDRFREITSRPKTREEPDALAAAARVDSVESA